MATVVPVTIPANQYLSNVAQFKNPATPVLLTMPDGWEPAVLLTILISVDGTNFYDLTNPDGTPVSAVVHPGTGLLLKNLVGWANYAQLRSGTYQGPVPQLQDRTFQFITDP